MDQVSIIKLWELFNEDFKNLSNSEESEYKPLSISNNTLNVSPGIILNYLINKLDYQEIVQYIEKNRAAIITTTMESIGVKKAINDPCIMLREGVSIPQVIPYFIETSLASCTLRETTGTCSTIYAGAFNYYGTFNNYSFYLFLKVLILIASYTKYTRLLYQHTDSIHDKLIKLLEGSKLESFENKRTKNIVSLYSIPIPNWDDYSKELMEMFNIPLSDRTTQFNNEFLKLQSEKGVEAYAE